jgi:hypothetical protein
MSRAKTQTTGYGRPLGPSNPKPMTEAAKKLLARSRGNQLQPARFNGIEFPAARPLLPPHRRRDWREAASPHTQTCNECGRSIMPHEQHYADQVSGHLVRHVACHEKAETQA